MIGTVTENKVPEPTLKLLRAWHPPRNVPLKVTGTIQYLNHQYLVVESVLSDEFLPPTLYLATEDSFVEDKALQDATAKVETISDEIKKTEEYLKGLKLELKELIQWLRS